MSVWRLTSFGHSLDALVRQLLIICLLGLGAGIIFWLSGGIPPKTWRVLLESCLRFNTLWAQQGAGVLVPFFIVVVQSLLVGIAWTVFGWLAFREGSALFALLAPQQRGRSAAKSPANKLVATSQSSRPALMAPGSSTSQSSHMKRSSTNSGPHMSTKKGPRRASLYGQHKERTPPNSSEAMFQFAPPFKEDWLLPPDQHAADPTELSANSGALWAYEDYKLKNPFEDEAAIPRKSLELKAMAAPPKQNERPYPLPFDKPQPPTGVQQYYTMTNPLVEIDDVEALRSSARELSTIDEPAYTMEEASAPCEEGDFAAMLNNFGFLPQQEALSQYEAIAEEQSPPVEEPPAAKSPAAKPTPVKKIPKAKPVTNPFDVQEQHLPGSGENFVLGDPFAVKEQSLLMFASESSPENSDHEQAPAQPTADPGFLFGNPFDGPLPEVFQHDAELKRSIAAQSKAQPAAPPSHPEREPENSDDNKPVKRRRSRGKRGKGPSQSPDQPNQVEQ